MDPGCWVTGGVKPEEENIRGWFKGRSVMRGHGQQPVPKDVIKARNWAAITKLCSDSGNHRRGKAIGRLIETIVVAGKQVNGAEVVLAVRMFAEHKKICQGDDRVHRLTV